MNRTTAGIATGGTRISSHRVREGDYVRFMAHRLQAHLSDEWWKVTSIDTRAGNRYAPHQFHLVNAAGETALFAPSQNDRVLRHPYSQRQAERS